MLFRRSRQELRTLIDLTQLNTEVLQQIAQNQQEQTRVLKRIASPDSPEPSNIIPFPYPETQNGNH